MLHDPHANLLAIADKLFYIGNKEQVLQLLKDLLAHQELQALVVINDKLLQATKTMLEGAASFGTTGRALLLDVVLQLCKLPAMLRALTKSDFLDYIVGVRSRILQEKEQVAQIVLAILELSSNLFDLMMPNRIQHFLQMMFVSTKPDHPAMPAVLEIMLRVSELEPRANLITETPGVVPALSALLTTESGALDVAANLGRSKVARAQIRDQVLQGTAPSFFDGLMTSLYSSAQWQRTAAARAICCWLTDTDAQPIFRFFAKRGVRDQMETVISAATFEDDRDEKTCSAGLRVLTRLERGAL